MEGNLARGVASGVVTSTGSFVGEIATAIFWGSFNPKYGKEDVRRMRYIQSKYCQAYGDGDIHDCNAVIQSIDATSKLKMNEEGNRPANPFSSEKSFEDSLELSYYPVPGHQGRFAASHAIKSQAKINEYQLRRRKRPWIPKISSPGKPNDYINMFLEEMKTWLRNQLTLDTVQAEELRRRAEYISKVKHDNFYWCFPVESDTISGPSSSSNTGAGASIHAVIEFVHSCVLDALEVVTREEKNKSLQVLFKELNDHTMNAFEFGKNFLAFVTTTSTKVGADFISSGNLDGSAFDKGKLHRMILMVTDPVIKSYVTDMKATDKRIESGNVGYPSTPALLPSAAASATGDSQLRAGDRGAVSFSSGYEVDVPSYNESGISQTLYSVTIKDPKGNKWLVKKSFTDFKGLHQVISRAYSNIDVALPLPGPFPTLMPSAVHHLERANEMKKYLTEALGRLNHVDTEIRAIIARFLDTKEMILPEETLVLAENIPNVFVELKAEFREFLINDDASATAGASSSPGSAGLLSMLAGGKSKKTRVNAAGAVRDFGAFKTAWGLDWAIRIFEAYALLQRMATVLSWTLEINHFFVSMFGNTITFSKLPLRDILVTQKDIMGSFLSLCSDLYKYACQLNSEQQYRWHKNLQLSESQLNMLKYHTDFSILTITRIETEHLDYEAQLRRLQDVASRFQPFMNRVDGSLREIQMELGLTTRLTGADARADARAGEADSKHSSLMGSPLLIEDAKGRPGGGGGGGGGGQKASQGDDWKADALVFNPTTRAPVIAEFKGIEPGSGPGGGKGGLDMYKAAAEELEYREYRVEEPEEVSGPGAQHPATAPEAYDRAPRGSTDGHTESAVCIIS